MTLIMCKKNYWYYICEYNVNDVYELFLNC